MDLKPGEYLTEDLIKRSPELQGYRDFLSSGFESFEDRGDVRELISLAAVCLGYWRARGCRDADPVSDLADRFLWAADIISVDRERRLGGIGAISDGEIEYAYEVARCARAALAVCEDHQRGVAYCSREFFSRPPGEWAAVAEALVVDGLAGLQDWRARNVVHPAGLVSCRAEIIAKESITGGRIRPPDALSCEEGREVVSLDTASPTQDAYAALIPDSSRRWDSEICTLADLDNICSKAHMKKEARLFALARYLGIPRNKAAELVSIKPERVEAARKQFERQLPQIQKGLGDYLVPRRTKRKKPEK